MGALSCAQLCDRIGKPTDRVFRAASSRMACDHKLTRTGVGECETDGRDGAVAAGEAVARLSRLVQRWFGTHGRPTQRGDASSHTHTHTHPAHGTRDARGGHGHRSAQRGQAASRR